LKADRVPPFPARARLAPLIVWIAMSLAVPLAWAQQPQSTSSDKAQGGPPSEKPESVPEELGRLQVEWLIGPYIPVQGKLIPLTRQRREQVYLRQTFLTAGSYLARAFSAGLDQARGEPYGWSGGMTGYGQRYVARYGEFVIRNSLVAAGNAALAYEPRYDFCRCQGFWPRARHAISRNFVAYNRTEQELRPQIPLYAGSFAAGMLYSSWLPSRENLWKGGAFAALSQAGSGCGSNLVREFALDILRKFGVQQPIKPKPGGL
jgi:hypothetical protein